MTKCIFPLFNHIYSEKFPWFSIQNSQDFQFTGNIVWKCRLDSPLIPLARTVGCEAAQCGVGGAEPWGLWRDERITLQITIYDLVGAEGDYALITYIL